MGGNSQCGMLSFCNFVNSAHLSLAETRNATSKPLFTIGQKRELKQGTAVRMKVNGVASLASDGSMIMIRNIEWERSTLDSF